MAKPVTVNDVLDGQVALDLECLDRVYLNGWVNNLQVGGQVVSFLTAHLGYPIPSPAIFDKIGTAFRRAVTRFAEQDHIPVVRFTKADRKIDRMRPYLAAQAKTGRSGVAAIGIAQEYASVFTPTVDSGRSSWAAIRRYPVPRALASNADPMTAVESARSQRGRGGQQHVGRAGGRAVPAHATWPGS